MKCFLCLFSSCTNVDTLMNEHLSTIHTKFTQNVLIMHVNLSLYVPHCAQCLWPISSVCCLQKLTCRSQLPSESSDRNELIEH